MKYIDAEKLIAKILPYYESSKDKARYAMQTGTSSDCTKWDKAVSIYESVLHIITSLQQDHIADVSKMVESEHVADVSKMIEQPEVDLEKFISDFIDKKDAENNGRWCEEDIIEAMTQSYKFGRKGGLEV